MTRTDDITSGPIIKTVISLALPVMLGMFFEVALSVTDFFWVGKLGASAQDAVTSSMVVMWTIFASISLISIGLTALVSRHVGAGEPNKAAFFTWQALTLAVILSTIVSLAGYAGAPFILHLMGAGEATHRLAVPYLRIFFVSTVAFTLAETAYAAFRAAGDTTTPTIIASAAVLLNMVLDPLLIFGIGPFPELGVAGASLASAISMGLAAVCITWRLFSGKAGFELKGVVFTRPDLHNMTRIVRIGAPIACQQMVFVGVYWVLIGIVHRFGEPAGAAMGIGNRMESFSYLLCYGISLAASTMVGQNLGSKNPARAARCAWSAVGLGVAVTMTTSACFIILPGQIASIFTDDQRVMVIAVDYLIILGLSQITMATEIILEGAFSGAGDTVPPMLVGGLGSLARIPLAILLAISLGWGINGVWWTLTITTTVKAIILALWFKHGRWQLRQV
ncbi:MAG: MATE family efflux transporter [Candidatus Zixiibacteriota bacterium]|nr:MAG: MATE family efflux transporter [candidate division Zixibacteria bacterium]